MGDTLKKVQPGAPLRIPAATFNTFIDAARDFQTRTRGLAQDATPAVRRAGIVLVRNDSGYDRGRFDVLGIDSPIITPTDNEDAFKNQVAFSGSTPSLPGHGGRFVILLEPLATGAIGLGLTTGVCPVRLDVQDAEHARATVIDGDAANLRSADDGPAAILWKEAGTGTRWALIHLGPPDEPCLWGKAPITGSLGDPAWVDDGTATGNGCYVEVNPSRRDGTGVITAVTHKVWLPRNGRREDPNVRQGGVICYHRAAGGGYVAPGGCLDGKCNETVRIHLSAASIPTGWELFGQKRFLVGYDGDAYPTVGATGGFKLHGGDGDGAANNHDDHDPATTGTGTGPCLGSGCKGWVDGSFDHTETDNRPPYEVVCWIKRVD